MTNVPLLFTTFSLIGIRILLVLLLAGVQFCMARAAFRLIGSVNLEEEVRRRISTAAKSIIALMNAPLALLLLETFVAPRHLLLYSPPDRYQFLVRPISYAFFVWSLGSLFFVIASPIAMAAFASVQFFRRRDNDSGDGATIHVFDLSRRRFLQMGLAAAAAAPFAAAAYGAVAARFRKVVETVVVSIKELP